MAVWKNVGITERKSIDKEQNRKIEDEENTGRGICLAPRKWEISKCKEIYIVSIIHADVNSTVKFNCTIHTALSLCRMTSGNIFILTPGGNKWNSTGFNMRDLRGVFI